jgi:uncharacterized protein
VAVSAFIVRLIPPRPSFALDASEGERALMDRHGKHWQPRVAAGEVVVFGPVLGDAGSWGLLVVETDDEEELRAFAAADPAVAAGIMTTEVSRLLAGYVRPS